MRRAEQVDGGNLFLPPTQPLRLDVQGDGALEEHARVVARVVVGAGVVDVVPVLGLDVEAADEDLQRAGDGEDGDLLVERVAHASAAVLLQVYLDALLVVVQQGPGGLVLGERLQGEVVRHLHELEALDGDVIGLPEADVDVVALVRDLLQALSEVLACVAVQQGVVLEAPPAQPHIRLGVHLRVAHLVEAVAELVEVLFAVHEEHGRVVLGRSHGPFFSNPCTSGSPRTLAAGDSWRGPGAYHRDAVALLGDAGALGAGSRSAGSVHGRAPLTDPGLGLFSTSRKNRAGLPVTRGWRPSRDASKAVSPGWTPPRRGVSYGVARILNLRDAVAYSARPATQGVHLNAQSVQVEGLPRHRMCPGVDDGQCPGGRRGRVGQGRQGWQREGEVAGRHRRDARRNDAGARWRRRHPGGWRRGT